MPKQGIFLFAPTRPQLPTLHKLPTTVNVFIYLILSSRNENMLDGSMFTSALFSPLIRLRVGPEKANRQPEDGKKCFLLTRFNDPMKIINK